MNFEMSFVCIFFDAQTSGSASDSLLACVGYRGFSNYKGLFVLQKTFFRKLFFF